MNGALPVAMGTCKLHILHQYLSLYQRWFNKLIWLGGSGGKQSCY